MTGYIALLRAVNLGGHNSLPMSGLRAICTALGYSDVQTYIASGNIVFGTGDSEAKIKADLEAEIAALTEKRIGVLVRTASEIAAVLAANPFPEMRSDRTVAIFLDRAPPTDALDQITGQDGEEVRIGIREIYVHYGDNMGRSRLKLKAAQGGTARNMNTIAKLVTMAAGKP